MLIADFHIHSKYSRATSKQMDVEHLVEWAKLKGISLLGTGDFTHYLWLQELKNKLKPVANGLFSYAGINFILTAEVSNIYSKDGRGRRVHNILFAPDFATVDKINQELTGFGNLAADGRPMLGLDCPSLVEIVLGANPECFIVPSHIWTPWYSLFGSNSGFDTIEECFEKYSKDIYALETGLSSDPAMNWRLSALDRFSLISNSDAHSPSRLGREANVFNCAMDYYAILEALKKKDKQRFLYTVEFFPEEGKYHYDGHRNCNILYSPAETRKKNNICPVCQRPLTVGVMHRVEQLGDRPEGFVLEGGIPFKNLIPLVEIIAEAKGVGRAARSVEREYRQLIQKLGNEFDILLNISEEELTQTCAPRIACGILNVRRAKVKITPGFDGVYGKIDIFSEEDKKSEKQMTLF
ncbi:MAG: endonuclease Q family protein [Omnitrophica bacterium]|nr:endonuclease Q family protein [Candidatus Omnitrophota bacterium]